MFLTLEDPRAKIKGSRDPLGVQSIWTGFGRELVTNLTTVTTSVRNFSVLVLGRWLVQELVRDGGVAEEDSIGAFLRFEQLAAYARWVHHQAGDIRGIERVERFLAAKEPVAIADDSTGYILSDQRTYGLWGLYTASARTSGLATDGAYGVPQEIAEFVEEAYRPAFLHVERRLRRLVEKGGRVAPKKDEVVAALAAALPRKPNELERDVYRRYLRDAEKVSSRAAVRQRRLVSLLLREGRLAEELSRVEVESLAARARMESAEVAERLDRLLVLEPVLIAADEAFRLLQGRGGADLTSVAAELADLWGGRLTHLACGKLGVLAPEIDRHAGEIVRAMLLSAAEALHDGRYKDALRTLMEWNAHVMHQRGGAPWVRIEGRGRVSCRYRGSERAIIGGGELPEHWRYSYFIEALKRITRDLEPEA